MGRGKPLHLKQMNPIVFQRNTIITLKGERDMSQEPWSWLGHMKKEITFFFFMRCSPIKKYQAKAMIWQLEEE